MSNHDQALGTWPNAPLALVLAQVRFDTEVDTEYKEVAIRLKAAMGERFPSMKAVRPVTFVISQAAAAPLAGPKANEGEVGRELRSDDNRGSVRLQDGVMTYTTSLYKDSRHFLSEWRSMLDCLCAAGGVKVLRLGMRYIDFIIPAVGRMPEDYLDVGFTSSSNFFGETAHAAFTSYEYPKKDDGMMRVQYGRGFGPPSLPPDLDGSVSLPTALIGKYTQGPSAVLDIDRWRTDSRRLQAVEIADEFQRLRDDIRIAFNRIITKNAESEWSSRQAYGEENA